MIRSGSTQESRVLGSTTLTFILSKCWAKILVTQRQRNNKMKGGKKKILLQGFSLQQNHVIKKLNSGQMNLTNGSNALTFAEHLAYKRM